MSKTGLPCCQMYVLLAFGQHHMQVQGKEGTLEHTKAEVTEMAPQLGQDPPRAGRQPAQTQQPQLSTTGSLSSCPHPGLAHRKSARLSFGSKDCTPCAAVHQCFHLGFRAFHVAVHGLPSRCFHILQGDALWLASLLAGHAGLWVIDEACLGPLILLRHYWH